MMRGMDETTWVAIGAVAAAIAAAAGWLAAIVAVVTAVFFYRQLQEQRDTTQEGRIARHVKAEFGDQFSKIIAIEKQARDTVEEARTAARDTRAESEQMIAKLEGLLQQVDSASRQIAGEAETASETVDALLEDISRRLMTAQEELRHLEYRRETVEKTLGRTPPDSEAFKNLEQRRSEIEAAIPQQKKLIEQLEHDNDEIRRRRIERLGQASTSSGTVTEAFEARISAVTNYLQWLQSRREWLEEQYNQQPLGSQAAMDFDLEIAGLRGKIEQQEARLNALLGEYDRRLAAIIDEQPAVESTSETPRDDE